MAACTSRSLREGTENDVRYYVDADQLRELFDELVLPAPSGELGPTGSDVTAARRRSVTEVRKAAPVPFRR